MDTASQYSSTTTAVLLVDPYNDFLSAGGKLAEMARPVAESVNTVAHMRTVVARARQAGLPIFYVPHHRARPDDLQGWRHPTPYALGAHKHQVFAEGSWGGEWHPDFRPQPGDVIVKEHWGGSGFANTDLDLLLKQHGVSRVIMVGLLANTCIETTARFASELGYHVTLAGRDGRLQPAGHDRRARHQRPDLCACHSHHGGAGRQPERLSEGGFRAAGSAPGSSGRRAPPTRHPPRR
ncbi:isochorismatase family cysteine hydrolase [Uliginosibacterium sp. H1]|uniref:isochorismatase family cysteine hydrolase n=1 Tax=Uliginosibacterium sp. H1 TaxID=3114757 RepID=UPI002E16B710|nr:isochorismatase family cysteine hydrolase [Uliginosibacterium sp. H1]